MPEPKNHNKIISLKNRRSVSEEEVSKREQEALLKIRDNAVNNAQGLADRFNSEYFGVVGKVLETLEIINGKMKEKDEEYGFAEKFKKYTEKLNALMLQSDEDDERRGLHIAGPEDVALEGSLSHDEEVQCSDYARLMENWDHSIMRILQLKNNWERDIMEAGREIVRTNGPSGPIVRLNLCKYRIALPYVNLRAADRKYVLKVLKEYVENRAKKV